MNKKGFTLIELMICVLIIAVLTTIAIPVYTRVSEKAKTTEAIKTLETVASAEQRYALANNWYSSDFTDLDVNIVNEPGEVVDDETLKLNNFDVTVSEGVRGLKNTAFVRADRIKDNRTSYTIYRCIENGNVLCLDQDETDRITCADLGFENEADSMDPCGGNPVNDASSCGRNSGFWSTATGTCYTSAEERCTALSGTMDNGICKFVDNNATIENQILDDDMECQTSYTGRVVTATQPRVYEGGCSNSVINNNGRCVAHGAQGCTYSIINEGGVCSSDTYAGGCSNSIVNKGGVCESLSPNNASCNYATVNDGGVCLAAAEGYQGCYRATINSGGICRGESWQYACKEATINDGGVCIGSGYYSCRQITVNDGGIFVSKNDTAGYLNTYKGSGCCIDCNNSSSSNCGSSGHECPESRVSASQKAEYCSM